MIHYNEESYLKISTLLDSSNAFISYSIQDLYKDQYY